MKRKEIILKEIILKDNDDLIVTINRLLKVASSQQQAKVNYILSNKNKIVVEISQDEIWVIKNEIKSTSKKERFLELLTETTYHYYQVDDDVKKDIDNLFEEFSQCKTQVEINQLYYQYQDREFPIFESRKLTALIRIFKS